MRGIQRQFDLAEREHHFISDRLHELGISTKRRTNNALVVIDQARRVVIAMRRGESREASKVDEDECPFCAFTPVVGLFRSRTHDARLTLRRGVDPVVSVRGGWYYDTLTSPLPSGLVSSALRMDDTADRRSAFEEALGNEYFALSGMRVSSIAEASTRASLFFTTLTGTVLAFGFLAHRSPWRTLLTISATVGVVNTLVTSAALAFALGHLGLPIAVSVACSAVVAIVIGWALWRYQTHRFIAAVGPDPGRE
jgi:hypothetical protein